MLLFLESSIYSRAYTEGPDPFRLLPGYNAAKILGAVRKTADQVVAPVLPYEPVFPHTGIISKTLGLYQQCCINML